MTTALPTAAFDPCGTRHIIIGIPNTVDTLKTYVEAEGGFSPGFGSYGIDCWARDLSRGATVAPTQPDIRVRQGLGPGGVLIPWSTWQVGEATIRTEVCSVAQPSPAGEVIVTGYRVHVTNGGAAPLSMALYIALRPLGPAGWPIHSLAVCAEGDALLVEGHPALVAQETPGRFGVLSEDRVAAHALADNVPTFREATSPTGDCSGLMRFELTLAPGASTVRRFVCPVLPGRRAVGHVWDGVSPWAQLDLNRPNPATGGHLQPDPGLTYYRELDADALFAAAQAYWQRLTGRVTLDLPDQRWGESFAAIAGHVAMAMNEDAPDVTPVNYNVFMRDGAYVADILLKSGETDLARRAISYFLRHPFNGRSYPEADNPGQLLWIIGEYWRLTRDRAWLEEIFPAVRRVVALITYLRTTPEPHWVALDSLDFGTTLPDGHRRELKPGACDGFHPEYTEAFDLAGLHTAVELATALGATAEATTWQRLADALMATYDARFGADLGRGYGSYSVLWPCRLYPLDAGAGHQRFRDTGPQFSNDWRYFPLATAHQGLLAGNRLAGFATLENHLDHPQMRGWYAFDEGGPSGPGNWEHVRTTWQPGCAMPHGWAIAEFHLLLRDCLAFEDGERLVLLPGVPPAWFTHPAGLHIAGLPTNFGPLDLTYTGTPTGATMTLDGAATPPQGFILRLPPSLRARAIIEGAAIDAQPNGDLLLPRGTTRVTVFFGV